ncbi:uncharacterized protein LOC143561161 [Bidens hawaiensis]|uniref:uncharacterized protein LOC143561161 n=1 Tax=Bidens hawaiensis TaxID=980011 RepID=UPI00404B499F
MNRGRFQMQESNIRRELEKQQIREEIIAEEMARRRVLEAEVRNELMMEREMAMRRAACIPASHNNMPEAKFLNGKPIGLEEKLVMLIDDKYGRGGRLSEVRGFSDSPLQVLDDSPKITTPAPEDNKKEVMVYGKPDCVTLSGTKRKSTPPVSEVVVYSKPNGKTLSRTKRKSTPPVSEGSIQSGSDRSNKRVKEEWTCAVCQISTTSEQGLTQHVQGKKHQTKEAALMAQRTGANFGLGVTPNKPIIKQPQLALTTVTVRSNETNKPSNSSDTNDVTKKDMQLALTVFKPTSSEPNKPSSSSSPNDIKSGKNKKDKLKFWCEMCQVGAFSEAVMNDHKEGKKHAARLVNFLSEA